MNVGVPPIIPQFNNINIECDQLNFGLVTDPFLQGNQFIYLSLKILDCLYRLKNDY